MSDLYKDDIPQAMDNCARESVHAPGAIQSAGCLVSVDNGFQLVLQVSANIGDILGVTPEKAFDFSPDQLLSGCLLHQLRSRLEQGESLPLSLEFQQQWSKPTSSLQATVYKSDCRWVFEIEPLVSPPVLHPLALLNRWIRDLDHAGTGDQLLSRLVEAVESLTGFDRIMVYQFDEQWHGTVVSEKRRDGVESFLGHHFPATDIPPQVRALYSINPLRSIPDVAAPAVPLFAREDKAEGPLDMGPGYLRAFAPVHTRYLSNMGVDASLSVAIHGEDGLWGLLACHHTAPKPISPQVRDSSLALVQVASQRLFLLEARSQMRYFKRALDSRELVFQDREHPVKPEDVPVEEQGRKVLTPRKSFAVREEEVRGQSRPWIPHEVQTAQSLADDLAVAVSINHHIAHLNDELLSVNAQLESLVQTDSLTGVWNRYHLELSIDAEVNAAQRYHRPCAVLLFDVDHFKLFNDRHGHEAGDQVLKKLAVKVETCLRAADCFGRWGGEEFVILTGIEPDDAILLAERIRREVEQIDLGELGQVTISIGVARYHAGDKREQLVARADQAMYQAKNDGRNRVASRL